MAIAIEARFDLQDGEAFDLVAHRHRMVEEQIEARGVPDLAVLRAMRSVPRHRFVSPPLVAHAYEDRPLSIGHQQTISQPYIVAYMTWRLGIQPGARLLEVGTGCGYQTAVLGMLARDVHSVEIVPELARESAERLARLGYRNTHVKAGDGAQGWREHAPFDGIIVTCGAPSIPTPLKEQLALGGRLVCPVGRSSGDGQELVIIEKDQDGQMVEWATIPVRFVPLTGPHGVKD